MDDESLANLEAWSMRLYDSFAPVRELIEQHPELKEPIVEAIAEAMSASFRPMFYGPSLHDK